MSFGLCGAHRTGKTTLAIGIAESTKLQLICSPVSGIFKEMGFTVGLPLLFEERMDLQDEVLRRHIDMIDNCNGSFVSDRTTLDFAAYAVAEWGMFAPLDGEKRLVDYVNKCLKLSSMLYSVVLLVQPGIPYEEIEGKPPPSQCLVPPGLVAARSQCPVDPRELARHGAGRAWQHLRESAGAGAHAQ